MQSLPSQYLKKDRQQNGSETQESDNNGQMDNLNSAFDIQSSNSKKPGFLPLINEAKYGFPSKRTVALNQLHSRDGLRA